MRWVLQTSETHGHLSVGDEFQIEIDSGKTYRVEGSILHRSRAQVKQNREHRDAEKVNINKLSFGK